MKTEIANGRIFHFFTEKEDGFGPVTIMVTDGVARIEGTVYTEGEGETLYGVYVDLRNGNLERKEWK